MSMKKVCMSVLLLLVLTAHILVVFAEPVFQEDFNQNTDLDGWALYQWGKASTTSRAGLEDDTIGTMSVVSDGEYGEVLQVEDKSDEKIVRAERTVSNPVLHGKYVIEYDIKPDNYGIVVFGNAANKYASDANSYFMHVAHVNNKVEIRGDRILTSSKEYPVTQWHHVKVIINTMAKTADVFVDGDRIGEQIGFRFGGAAAALDTIAVGSMFHGSLNLKTATQFTNLMVSQAAAVTFPAGGELTVSRNFGDTLDLEWPPADGAVRYRLYQDGEEIAVLEPDVTNYQVTGLTPGQNYSFAIQAEDLNGMLTDDGPFCSVTAFAVEQLIYKSDFLSGMSDWQLFHYEAATNSRTENDSDENGAITTVADDIYGDTMRVTDTSTNFIMRAETNFPGYSGKCKVEFDAKLAEQSLIALADGTHYTANANNYMVHIMQNGSALQVRGGSIENSEAAFEPDVWRHFKIMIENSANARGKASVWVDGVLIAEKLDFRAGNKGQSLDTLIVGSGYSVSHMQATQVANIKIAKLGASDWEAPPILDVVNTTQTSITVQWEHASGNPAQYLVLIDGKLSDIIDSSINSYTAEGLAEATNYLFEIRALDADGVTSQFAAKQEIKTYNPNGFSVRKADFYLVGDTETPIEEFMQGKIRAKLNVTNDNCSNSDVTVLALLYRTTNGVRQLIGMNAVNGLKVEQGTELPVTIDILATAQANCLEICLIDTITGVMPLSRTFTLE